MAPLSGIFTTLQQDTGNLPNVRSCFLIVIRSLIPRKAAGNALAVHFQRQSVLRFPSLRSFLNAKNTAASLPVGSARRVIPSGMKGVALTEPDQRHGASPPNTVSLNGLAGIRRTRGIETAGWRYQGRNDFLICCNEVNGYISHLKHGTFYQR